MRANVVGALPHVTTSDLNAYRRTPVSNYFVCVVPILYVKSFCPSLNEKHLSGTINLGPGVSGFSPCHVVESNGGG
jgi:hypothetical protein